MALRLESIPYTVSQLTTKRALTDIDAMETSYPTINSYAVPYASTVEWLKLVKVENETAHPPEHNPPVVMLTGSTMSSTTSNNAAATVAAVRDSTNDAMESEDEISQAKQKALQHILEITEKK